MFIDSPLHAQGSAEFTRCGERLRSGACDHHSHHKHNAAGRTKVLEYSPAAQLLLAAVCTDIPALLQALLAIVQHTALVRPSLH